MKYKADNPLPSHSPPLMLRLRMSGTVPPLPYIPSCHDFGEENCKHVLMPNLSVKKHNLHSGNIMCVGGYRKYKCRSINTDYQSNCISATMFISTYFIMQHFICPKPKSAVYSTDDFITTTCSLISPFSCVP